MTPLHSSSLFKSECVSLVDLYRLALPVLRTPLNACPVAKTEALPAGKTLRRLGYSVSGTEPQKVLRGMTTLQQLEDTNLNPREAPPNPTHDNPTK